MKKILTLLLTLLSANSFTKVAAELPVGNIENLNTTYTTPRGVGSADTIDIKGFGTFTRPKLEIENDKGLLIFSIDNKSFKLDISMLGITDIDSINVLNLNYKNLNTETDKSFYLGSQELTATAIDFKLAVGSGGINCIRSIKYTDPKDDILSACISDGVLKFTNLLYRGGKKSFISLIDKQVLGETLRLDSFKFILKNNRFSGNFKGEITKNITVKMKGNSWYDAKTNLLKIKITKAKAGWFNIKSKLFKALKKEESETFKVNSPYIYITLQDK